MEGIVALSIPISITYILFWGIISILRVNRESAIKARMVELGHLEPDKQWITQKSASVADTYANLKYGLLLVSVGIGFMLVKDLDIEFDSTTIIGIISMVAGLGFLVYFLIMKYLYRKAD